MMVWCCGDESMVLRVCFYDPTLCSYAYDATTLRLCSYEATSMLVRISIVLSYAYADTKECIVLLVGLPYEAPIGVR
eukprot:1089660-Rhodomonas_salina.1